ncbi:MOB kinase activator 3A,MOB kinase activator 3B [Lepeophtheirus salmonis]|uniref:MOB kinase activator 3A,MOB kinase activator 3B n=1 Tax=Lepeophtheirus salmonis TaxID=72036 RepID=A0A7R8CWL9_LEPSM|nr:MOB kinase activator 3A,MOB kinase activator 3B [Lepeophtheirus salmonis]CAF2953442.1 MOB kinase activator 3A,MOB kinase activator 3B [Lepeophtheirus salmonis]
MESFFEKLRIGNDPKTALRRKNFKVASARFSLHQNTLDSLMDGIDLETIIKCPVNESIEDWLASHVVEFYNKMEALYLVIISVCTPETCPVMCGGAFTYLWQDNKKLQATRLPATQYIETLLDWVHDQIHDENLFPPNTSKSFPPNFKKVVTKIFVRLYRVFVHIYLNHFDRLKDLDAVEKANVFLQTLLSLCQRVWAPGSKRL